MDKRIAGQAIRALAAIAVGAAVLFADGWIIGLFAAQAGPTPHDITRGELEMRGLWHGLLWFWSLPAALGALLIACLKPRRWAFYSAWSVWPGFTLLLYQAAELVQDHRPVLLLTSYAVVSLALLPLFLGLYYALIRRHASP